MNNEPIFVEVKKLSPHLEKYRLKIKVKVKPNSRENSIKEIEKNYYEVKVSVPPEKGKANEKVTELVSKHLKIPKSHIELISGAASKDKVFIIPG